jgi:tetratricopeptide (TPR) repeat protein
MLSLARSLLAGTLAVALVGQPSLVHASPFAIDTAIAPGGDESGGDEDDPVMAEAMAEYRAGSDAYALGNYEEAVTHFERAYELTHQPELLFNLGQSYTRWYDISNDIDHLKKARRLYENYVLNVGATDLDEEQQAQASADAQRRITEVDRRIAQHEDARPGPGPDPNPNGDTDKPKKPVHKKAWFWVAIVGGLAVVGGVTAAVVLTTRKEPGFEPELGTIGASSPGGLTLRF